MRELDPNTPITRYLRRYQERGISHDAEDDNDFTDRVVSNRDRSLLVIRVRDHIDHVNIVEHDLNGSEQDSHRRDGWVAI